MDDSGGMKPFNDPEAKLRFLFTSQSIRLLTPLPCATQDCMNMALAASADYDPVMGYWCVSPVCKACIKKMYAMYQEPPGFLTPEERKL